LDPDLRLQEKSFDLFCGKKPEVLQLYRFSDSETVLILYRYESPQFAAYIWKTIGLATIFMKLYVGNFSLDMTERTLRELFEPFGTVSEVKLITDRETGQSRGFGFVTMSNVSEGNAAIKGLDGKDKGGRKLKVNEARPKDDHGGRPRPSPRSRR
jgi:RNA recognition motif. (a.k.a. RRM, RBD, or RNP domain)